VLKDRHVLARRAANEGARCEPRERRRAGGNGQKERARMIVATQAERPIIRVFSVQNRIDTAM